jgi:hypothetical protein
MINKFTQIFEYPIFYIVLCEVKQLLFFLFFLYLRLFSAMKICS